MRSPSSSSMTRIVPCMAGGDGPMFRSIVAGRACCWVRDGMLFLQGDEGLTPAEGIVLAERMTLQPVVHEDPPEVGVALETHAKKVIDFALQPVGVLPERGQRGDPEIALVDSRLNPQAPVPGKRKEMNDQLKARLPARVVDTGQVQKHLELPGPVPEEGRDWKERLLVDDRDLIAQRSQDFFHSGRKFLAQPL